MTTIYNIFEEDGVIECANSSLNVPRIYGKYIQNDNLYLLLNGECKNRADCIEPPNKLRNLISIQKNCNIRWFCQRIPKRYIKKPKGIFHKIIVPYFGDNIITRGPNGRFFEFNNSSGILEDTWSSFKFKIDGSTILFDNKIDYIDTIESNYLIRCKDGGDTKIICYNTSGDLKWERKFEGDWSPHIHGGDIYVIRGHYTKELRLEDGTVK